MDGLELLTDRHIHVCYWLEHLCLHFVQYVGCSKYSLEKIFIVNNIQVKYYCTCYCGSKYFYDEDFVNYGMNES